MGDTKPVAYNEVNAVLFDTMEYLKKSKIGKKSIGGTLSEVDISIIRILEALKNKKDVGWKKVLRIYRKIGLEDYILKSFTELSARRAHSSQRTAYGTKAGI